MNNRWIKVTLAISLTINLLFIGALLGRISSGVPLARPFPPHLGWVLRSLDPQTRQQLRPQLAEQMKNAMPMRKHLKAAQQAVNRLLLQEPLDRVALTRSMEELRKYSSESQRQMHADLIAIMTELNLEQRQKVMKFLNRNWRSEMTGRRRNHPPTPP